MTKYQPIRDPFVEAEKYRVQRDRLTKAAKAVLGQWQNGDLASAIRDLAAALEKNNATP